MPTKEEIKLFYKNEHDRITKAFYIDHILPKSEFDSQHQQNYANLERALSDNGYTITIWHYELSATILTPQGDTEILIQIDTPRQLTLAEKSVYVQRIKNATWTVKVEKSDIVEV